MALYIAVEAPVSGMSLNPARSLGSALAAHDGRWLWIYASAPPLGMLLGAWLHARLPGARPVACAKLDHTSPHRCIFRCDFHRLVGAAAPGARP